MVFEDQFCGLSITFPSVDFLFEINWNSLGSIIQQLLHDSWEDFEQGFYNITDEKGTTNCLTVYLPKLTSSKNSLGHSFRQLIIILNWESL